MITTEDGDIDENYLGVSNFLESIQNNLDKNYFVLSFKNEKIEKEINILLKNKYAVKVTQDEKLRRKMDG